MPGHRDAAAIARGSRGSAVPDLPRAPGQPVPRSLQEIILIPEGDAERSPLSLPAPGCSQPVPQAFPRSAACQASEGSGYQLSEAPAGAAPSLRQRLLARLPAPRALPELRTSASPALAWLPAVLTAPSHVLWQDIQPQVAPSVPA